MPASTGSSMWRRLVAGQRVVALSDDRAAVESGVHAASASLRSPDHRPGLLPGSASHPDGAATTMGGGSVLRGGAGRESPAGRSGRSRRARAARVSARPAGRPTPLPAGARAAASGSDARRPTQRAADRPIARAIRASAARSRARRGRPRGVRPASAQSGRRSRPCPGRSSGPGSSRQRRQLLFLGADLFGEPRDRDQIVHRLEVVDVQLAVEMIELMLNGARQQSTA